MQGARFCEMIKLCTEQSKVWRGIWNLYATTVWWSLFSSLVQPVLSYGCEIWGLEHVNNWRQMSSIHHMFMKRTLHVGKSTPSDIILCELGQVPLHLFWHKMLLQYVGRLVDLPNDRLVKQAFTHAQQQKTIWFQKLSSWLSDYGFQGLNSKWYFFSIKCHDHFAGQVVQSSLSVGLYQGKMFHRQHVF